MYFRGKVCSKTLKERSVAEQESAFGFRYRNMNQGRQKRALSDPHAQQEAACMQKAQPHKFSKYSQMGGLLWGAFRELLNLGERFTS